MSNHNEFRSYSTILRELQSLDPITRGRVMDAVEAEINDAAVQHADLPDAEVIPPGETIMERMGRLTGLPDPAAKDMLPIGAAAEVAKVSKQALYVAIRRGHVKADKSSGSILVSRAAALAYKGQPRGRPKSRRSKK